VHSEAFACTQEDIAGTISAGQPDRAGDALDQDDALNSLDPQGAIVLQGKFPGSHGISPLAKCLTPV